jgi:hypothetical protein
LSASDAVEPGGGGRGARVICPRRAKVTEVLAEAVSPGGSDVAHESRLIASPAAAAIVRILRTGARYSQSVTRWSRSEVAAPGQHRGARKPIWRHFSGGSTSMLFRMRGERPPENPTISGKGHGFSLGEELGSTALRLGQVERLSRAPPPGPSISTPLKAAGSPQILHEDIRHQQDAQAQQSKNQEATNEAFHSFGAVLSLHSPSPSQDAKRRHPHRHDLKARSARPQKYQAEASRRLVANASSSPWRPGQHAILAVPLAPEGFL